MARRRYSRGTGRSIYSLTGFPAAVTGDCAVQLLRRVNRDGFLCHPHPGILGAAVADAHDRMFDLVLFFKDYNREFWAAEWWP